MPLTPRIRVAVILPQGDEILFVRHQKGERSYWLLPGGGVEFGESIEDCARRELLEETGLQIVVDRFVWMNEAIAPTGDRHIVNIFLLGRVVGGELNCEGDERLRDAVFHPIDQIESLVIYPPIADQLLRLHRSHYTEMMGYLGNRWIP